MLIENSLLKPVDQKETVEESQKSFGSSKNSSDGNMPDTFEMIDKNNECIRKSAGSINLDDNISNNSSNVGGDWTNITINTTELVDNNAYNNKQRSKRRVQEFSSDNDFFNCQSSR